MVVAASGDDACDPKIGAQSTTERKREKGRERFITATGSWMRHRQALSLPFQVWSKGQKKGRNPHVELNSISSKYPGIPVSCHRQTGVHLTLLFHVLDAHATA